MKNIFKIYKSDLKDIFRNKVLLIIILGLAFLPSLYAWFNIKASWDPYGNTKNLSVAVVNKDKSVTINDKTINVGKEVIEKLKSNDKLGWKFVDEKEAIKGVKTGKYYASIEIPENFSKNISSVTSNDIKKGEIIYTVNEKLNAIAPKITDKGATNVQTELNQIIVKTVSEVIFKISNDVGMEIENQLPKLNNLENELVSVQQKFKDVEKTVSLASDSTYKIDDVISDFKKQIPTIKTTITDAKNLTSDMKTFLNDSKKNIESVIPVVKNDLQVLLDVSTNTSSNVKSLLDAINQGATIAPEYINNIYVKLDTLSKNNETIIEFLKGLSQFDTEGKLQEPIKQLEVMRNDINSAINLLNTLKEQLSNPQSQQAQDLNKLIQDLNKLLQVSNEIKTMTSGLLNSFDSKISAPLNNMFEQSFKIANNIESVLNQTESKLPEIENILNTGTTFSSSAKDTIKFINEKLPVAKNIVDELVNAVDKINNGEDIKELISALKNDVNMHSNFLEQPVELVTKRLYELPNYGTGMTPFYTVLALWVGILLLMSILSTDSKGDYTSLEVYFGRGLTILTIAILQSLIVSSGDIFILKVSVKNPALFIALSVFISIVFVSIIYSLVSVFASFGKAIAIILMVIQVSASGGTFPIEVTPEFFQNVNPFLPFTYGISILRESISGIYEPNLIKGISLLAVFLVVSILFAVILKKPINKSSESIKTKLRETDLME